MITSLPSARRFIAASLMIGTLAAGLPAIGWAADAPKPAAAHTPIDRVAQRIGSLHDKLHITAEQQTVWQPFADAMAENAKTVSDLMTDRASHASTLSAIDDMKSYAAIADAHAAGLKKLVPLFEAVYASMSDAQKKNADLVYGKFEGRTTHAATAKP